MTEPAWGTPPWRIVRPPTGAALPTRCDVAVVGGGLTGLSVAYHLARRNIAVVLLEASHLGAGASGRTGGIVLEGTAAGPRPDADHCLDGLAGLVREANVACDLALPGCWELAHHDDSGGMPDWRDGSQFLRVVDTVPGGIVDPGALVSGLARAAIDAGATLHEECRVTRLEPGPPAVLHVGERTLRAERVALGLNAYTTELVQLPVAFTAALTLAVCTAPLAAGTVAAIGLGAHRPFYTADLPYLWGRPLGDDRLVMGAGLVFAGDAPVAAVRTSGEEPAAIFGRLEARVRGLHPALADAVIAERWGGPIAFLSHRAPLLCDLPGAPHVVLAGGYAGHGVALSVRAGELLAEALVDGRPLPAWGALD